MEELREFRNQVRVDGGEKKVIEKNLEAESSSNTHP